MLSESIRARVAREYPQADQPLVLEELEKYVDRERDRVHEAILTLSSGNVRLLRHNVEVAVTDYRDVLLWADNPQERRLP